jgi:serine/threonine protein kinase
MAIEVGQLFGNYRMVRLLGEGGFGEVYLVENPLIQRRAAVKVLHAALAQDAELVRRFLNEARAASAIRHPNIIDVLDAGGTADGAPYILMEFLEGVSLQKRLADVGRFSLPQVLDIANQAGSALAAAHAAGIVHRDLKPENLFLVPDPAVPSGERVKVLDFGIAKIKHGSTTGGMVKTRTGIIMGSPAYMSPEQCKDSADVDLRSDVYSFATIVYEMLAGRTPYVAASATELLVMHLTETPQPLRELVPDVPPHVESAIAKALSRARDGRFDTMASFIGALIASSDGATAVRRSPHPAERLAVSTNAASQDRLIAALPASTTFSRATGEVGAAESDEELSRATRPRRWPVFVVGGVVAAGLGLFLVMPGKPDRDSAVRATPVALPTKTVEPVQQETPLPTLPAVLPGKPDAGAVPSALAKALPATKPADGADVPAPKAKKHRHEANAASSKMPANAKPDLGASIQTPKKPAGVAGF